MLGVAQGAGSLPLFQVITLKESDKIGPHVRIPWMPAPDGQATAKAFVSQFLKGPEEIAIIVGQAIA